MLHDFGVRVGFVWKKDYNGWQQINADRPHSAYNVPITISEPGPDGNLATAGDNTQITVFNLDRTNRLPTTIVQNIDGYEGTYKTLEFSANKRYSNRWSMIASYSYVWTNEFNNQYFTNRFGSLVSQQSTVRSLRPEPERPQRERVHQLERQAVGDGRCRLGHEPHPGAEDAERRAVRPLRQHPGLHRRGHRQLPELRQPAGAGRADRHAPPGHRHACSTSAPRSSSASRSKARVGVFMDVFNIMNSNTAVNIAWVSGATFERATTVLNPRIAKFGVKFDW